MHLFIDIIYISNLKMDKFPDDFNRQTWQDILTKNQKELLKQVRDQFYQTSIKARDDCDLSVILEFPEKLWDDSKIIIINELLEKWGKITIQAKGADHSISKAIINTENLPKNIIKVTIEFIVF